MPSSDSADIQLEHLTPSSFLHHQEGRLLRELGASAGPERHEGRDAPSPLALPRILAHLQTVVRNIQGGAQPCVPVELRRHLEQRVALPDFSLRDAVREVTVLRRCIIRGWLKTGVRAPRSEGVTILDEALDQLSLAVLDCWTEAQQRTLKALDRVSALIAQSRHLPELLAGVARLLAETGSHARWVTLWLKDGAALVQRAAWGLDLPEGAARVRLPKELDMAGADAGPHTTAPSSWQDLGSLLLTRQGPEEGPSVLLPILHEGQLLGLARVGHAWDEELSQDERSCLASMLERAAPSIIHLQLKDQLEVERDDFLNVLVHDLKTPLSAVSVAARLARNQAQALDGHPLEGLLEKIQSQVTRISRLLNDLLDLRMLSAGRFRVLGECLDLRPLVRELASEWQSASPSHTIVVEMPEGALVEADPVRVTQVLNNLLSNAVKYSPEGAHIRVSAWVRPEEVITWVEDEGIGIEPSALSGVFERYTRTQGGKVQAKGHGIGLFIASELVRLQGGRMWLESTVEKGSTFYFSLPRWRPGPTPPPRA
ncbi:HAMP domain-containing sensor histidine kinase [Myxococcus sp. SDU36]|uniref:sensor histidine kinase n=1 Tax=Myxococcus sp. SDU36 TaxID=2831967 RepID=UPI0025431B72|nr:HAMP domain-containing sensor histidine kinase [Myxococcus sp. SDU36]WIG97916.1 HAMP domain-containing histidine kinase [Myxococcus sp. SDU36]